MSNSLKTQMRREKWMIANNLASISIDQMPGRITIMKITGQYVEIAEHIS